jgi:filamentous hemagglutinin family protein
VGNTNDIVLLSILVANPEGITISNKSILNFPKSVAETAVSKSAGAVIER